MYIYIYYSIYLGTQWYPVALSNFLLEWIGTGTNNPMKRWCFVLRRCVVVAALAAPSIFCGFLGVSGRHWSEHGTKNDEKSKKYQYCTVYAG